jgi:hypothetical protein
MTDEISVAREKMESITTKVDLAIDYMNNLNTK